MQSQLWKSLHLQLNKSVGNIIRVFSLIKHEYSFYEQLFLGALEEQGSSWKALLMPFSFRKVNKQIQQFTYSHLAKSFCLGCLSWPSSGSRGSLIIDFRWDASFSPFLFFQSTFFFLSFFSDRLSVNWCNRKWLPYYIADDGVMTCSLLASLELLHLLLLLRDINSILFMVCLATNILH